MPAVQRHVIDDSEATYYVVCWRRKGEEFINREYCSTLSEAERWKESHEKSGQCEFCIIERTFI